MPPSRTANGLRLFALAMRFVAVAAALWATVAGFASPHPAVGLIGLLVFAVALAWALLRLRTYRGSQRD